MTASRHVQYSGTHLRFFMHANAKHGGVLLYEWLLRQAHREGLAGGSVFRAIAGFGRHGVLHEETFFELAGELPVRVEFVLSDTEAERMLAIVRKAGVELVYARSPIEFGVLSRDPD